MAVVLISFDPGSGHVLRDLRAGTLEIVSGINGRWSLRAQILSLDGSYQPDVDDEVIVTIDTLVAFRGLVVDTSVDYLAMGSGIVTTVDAADYSSLAERRVVTASTGGGITGRDAIDYIVDTYLAGYGVTREASMPTGATLGALSYNYVKATEVLDDIVRIAAPAGWLWRIDENKVLQAFQPGLSSWACPFTVETASPNVVGDISIKQLREEYANRVYLSYGDSTGAAAAVMSEDAAAQTARGIYEVAISTPGPMDATTAQQVCDGYLAKLVNTPTEIRFNTLEGGAAAGQTLEVDLAARGLSGDFLITELQARDLDGKNVMYTVAAIDGGSVRYSWKDTYINWARLGSERGGATWTPVPTTTDTITFDNAANLGDVTATSHTASFTCQGTNRILWVAVAGDGTNDLISGVTYGGVAMTLIRAQSPADSNNNWLYLFMLVAPATGANNVVITASSSSYIGAVAASYMGVAQSGQPDNSSWSAAPSTVQTYASSITPVVDGCWVVCAWNAWAFNDPPVAGSSTVRRAVEASDARVAFFDSNGPVSPAASRALETTWVVAWARRHTHILATMAPAVVVAP